MGRHRPTWADIDRHGTTSTTRIQAPTSRSIVDPHRQPMLITASNIVLDVVRCRSTSAVDVKPDHQHRGRCRSTCTHVGGRRRELVLNIVHDVDRCEPTSPTHVGAFVDIVYDVDDMSTDVDTSLDLPHRHLSLLASQHCTIIHY